MQEYLQLIQSAQLQQIVDVRTVPRSRRNPQFDSDNLAWELEQLQIDYRHEADLGGLRKPRPDSTHTALREEGMRGYADHMESERFDRAAKRLLKESQERRCAVMCAEAEPWRCHRSLLSDALTVRGAEVLHRIRIDDEQRHRLTPMAQADGERLRYRGLL